MLVFVNTQTGEIVKKLKVANEPYGIVANAEGTTTWVTHDYPGLISEIDLKAMTVKRQIKVTPYLRGIAYRKEEQRLYVSGWYSGTLYAVDLAQGKVVDEWVGNSTDNLARNVAGCTRRGPRRIWPISVPGSRRRMAWVQSSRI